MTCSSFQKGDSSSVTDPPPILPLRVSLKAAQPQDTPLASGTLQIYMGMMTTFSWLVAVKHPKEGVSYSSYRLLDTNPRTVGKGGSITCYFFSVFSTVAESEHPFLSSLLTPHHSTSRNYNQNAPH